MNKLLKQLIMVLEENGIQLSKVNLEDNIPGEISIEVNKEITIVDRGGNYALYTEDASLDKTFYSSLTEALEVVANYLGRVKVGDTLVSKNGETLFKVVAYLGNDLYNLIDEETNILLYSEGKSLEHIYKTRVEQGNLQVK
ncbi:hypothetical protein WOJGOHIN_CDS0075 [Staphylococcus phage PG-2021_87]